MRGFNDMEEAKKYAYECAYKDMIENETSEKVITEDEITDNNGPGKYGSPYNSIIGYGGRYEDGYSTTFYCVVEWFDGVTNMWDEMDEMDEKDVEDEMDEKDVEDGEWYPRYG
jgi:hypothetical protein